MNRNKESLSLVIAKLQFGAYTASRILLREQHNFLKQKKASFNRGSFYNPETSGCGLEGTRTEK